MSIMAMNFISELMRSLSIPYAFMEWKEKPPEDRYFVGDFIEEAMNTMEEDGRQSIRFILRGFTRGDWMLLMRDKETIEKNVAKTAILQDGTGIAVFYESGMLVPTGDEQLKSIKINLQVQEWKVN